MNNPLFNLICARCHNQFSGPKAEPSHKGFDGPEPPPGEFRAMLYCDPCIEEMRNHTGPLPYELNKRWYARDREIAKISKGHPIALAKGGQR